MSQKLGVNFQTAKAQAVRLGLPFPRYGGKSTKLTSLTAAQTLLVFEEKLERYRKAWLSLLQDNLEDGVERLSRKSPGVYSWLRIHDREWLYRNRELRDRRIKLLQKPRIDWESRDQRLAHEARSSAKRLKTNPGAPVLVSRAAIARDIGASTLFSMSLDKLPLTASALAEITETREDFAIRKIHWTADCYRQECACPTLYQFILRAGIHRIVGVPRVKEAAIVALESLSL